MINFYDIAYSAGLIATAPAWLLTPALRRKVLKAFRQQSGHVDGNRPDGVVVMIHAVSLGEVNAARALIAGLLNEQDDLTIYLSATTDTGFVRAQELYRSSERVRVMRYPFDLSAPVNRVLDAVRPDLIVLMELEVWPNFMLQCDRRGIPVVLVNGRLTERSFRSYRAGGPIVRRMFRRVAAICAQEQAYADRFICLGAPAERVRVTGTMKFDTAQIADRIDGDSELAQAVGLHPGVESIWVCGSTGPGEEILLLQIYEQLLEHIPKLRLVIVPRKPERFDEVEKLIRDSGMPCLRRSRANADPNSALPAVVLGDTMGELRKFYSVADVVFVGRTLVDLGSRQHGSDMIEPAALAKPVIVGPYTGNFAEVMNCLRADRAIKEISRSDQFRDAVLELLSDRPAAIEMGRRAQDVVRQQRGATARDLEIIRRHLRKTGPVPAGSHPAA